MANAFSSFATPWFKQHRLYLYGIAALTLAGMGLYGGREYWVRQNERHMEEEMTHAVYAFEAGNYAEALAGASPHAGFVELIQRAGNVPAQRLARFYAGVCAYRQADYEAAIRYLTGLKIASPILQARAWAVLGDTCAQQENLKEAITYYLKAAAHHSNAAFSPYYLRKAAIAQEAAGELVAAAATYQKMVDQFSKTPYHAEAQLHAARLQGQAS